MGRCQQQGGHFPHSEAEADPEERGEELLDRAGLSAAVLCPCPFLHLAPCSQPASTPAPLPHQGTGRGPGPCGNACFCPREQLLLLGLKSIREGFLLSSVHSHPDSGAEVPMRGLQAAASFLLPHFLFLNLPFAPSSGHLFFLAALRFLFPFVPACNFIKPHKTSGYLTSNLASGSWAGAPALLSESPTPPPPERQEEKGQPQEQFPNGVWVV